MESFVFWIGIAAAAAITAANVPQALKIFRTGDTKSISSWTYVLLVIGNALWLIYGILKQDLPLLIANSISTFLCVAILIMKLFPGLVRKGKPS